MLAGSLFVLEDPDAAIHILENMNLATLAETQDTYPELTDLIQSEDIWKKLIKNRCTTDKLWNAVSKSRPWCVHYGMVPIFFSFVSMHIISL